MKVKRDRPSNRQLASRMGISRQAVDQWFMGVSRPSLDNAVRLALALDMTIEQAVLLVHEEVVHRRRRDTGETTVIQ